MRLVSAGLLLPALLDDVQQTTCCRLWVGAMCLCKQFMIMCFQMASVEREDSAGRAAVGTRKVWCADGWHSVGYCMCKHVTHGHCSGVRRELCWCSD
jgi:hypothetical protein